MGYIDIANPYGTFSFGFPGVAHRVFLLMREFVTSPRVEVLLADLQRSCRERQQMKSALLIENDHVERARLAKILGWIGFQAAPASTPKQALNVAHSIKFNVIVTCTYLLPDDRRALTSELKRLAPEAIIVLLTCDEEEYRKARAGCCLR